MMHISIRPAAPDDWPTIVEFNCRLAEESEGKRLDRTDLEPGVKALLADPRKGRYFLAEVQGEKDERSTSNIQHPTSKEEWSTLDVGRSMLDVPSPLGATSPDPPLLRGGGASGDGGGRIVGQMMHTFEWSDWRNGDIWWLQSVYVHPDFRRMGVFSALFEHLRAEAEADPGVVGLRLYVEEQNTEAHATYEKLGLAPGGYFVMERMLRRSDLSVGISPP